MRAISTLLGIAVLLAPLQALPAQPPLTQSKACAVLKTRVSKVDGIPENGPIGVGWFCDFSRLSDRQWFVVALRSNRQCEGICSNLMGWYAVNRGTGAVHQYDAADLRVGAKLETNAERGSKQRTGKLGSYAP
jgi:hypothetical protein